MKSDTVIIRFEMKKRNKSVDLEVPLSISAYDLIVALNAAYDLGVDASNIKSCYLQAEYPIALLKGNKTLAEFGIRQGTVIYFTE